MTDEERLAALLRQAVPQPPRSMTVEDIAAQLSRAPATADPRLRRWSPALAAACVLLLIAAASVWLISGRSPSSAPPAHSPSASSPAPTAADSESFAPPGEELSGWIGALGSHALNNASLNPVIAAGADAVYGLGSGQLDRFDPSSGAITAQAPVDPGASWPPLVTNDALWEASGAAGTVTVQALDPRTLRKVSSVQVAGVTPTSTGPQWRPVLAASPDAATLFLGNADHVYALDPVSGAVEHQTVISGLVGALAVSADGSRLYVGENAQRGAASRLLVLNSRDAFSTISDTPLGERPVISLLVTAGAVWATVGSPDISALGDSYVRFARLSDLSRTRLVTTDGGVAPATATLVGGVVWLGGPFEMGCADASTGRFRYHARLMSETGLPNYFGAIHLVAGHWLAINQPFGIADSNDLGLATFTPPAACR